MSRKKKIKDIPGNDRVARLWMKAQDFEKEDAQIDFEDAIHALLDSGKMTQARIDAIAGRVSPEDILDFIQDVERAASMRPLHFEDGVQAFSQLFIIPLFGDLDAIERETSRQEILDALARGLRETGYSRQKSNVIVHPGLLALTELASIDILDVHEVSKESICLLSGTSSGTPRMKAIADRAAAQTSPRGAVTAGTRFLIGARLAILDEDIGDGLLQEEDDDVKALEKQYLREKAWYAMVEELPDLDYHIAIQPPVPWSEARSTLLFLHTWQTVTLALSSEGLGPEDLKEGDLSVGVVFAQDALEIDVYRHDRKVVRVSLPNEVVGNALKDFIDLVEAQIGPIVTNDVRPDDLGVN
jgi:hypothetical protein